MPKEGSGFFYGWVIVFGAWLCMFVSMANQWTFSVMIIPLMDEYGWTEATLSLAMALNMLFLPAFGLVAGLLVDRLGPRLTVVIGAIVGGTGVILLSQTNSVMYFVLMYGIMVPSGIALTYMVTTLSTVRRWFMRKAALAIAISMTGAGLGIIIFMPIVASMVNSIGWRTAYVVMGIILIVGATIGGLLLRKDPESSGQYPDGEKPDPEMIKLRVDFAARNERWSVKEAFSNKNMWLLIPAQMGYVIAVAGLMGFIVAWGVDLKITFEAAVGIMSFFICASLVGRLTGGLFSDWHMAKFPGMTRKPILYICIFGIALGCFLGAIIVNGYVTLLLIVLIIGFSYGNILTVIPTYLGDLFGVANMPTLFGAMLASVAGLSALGPLLYGNIRATTGSYDVALLITCGLCIISVIFLYLIQQPHKKVLAS
ncbi:MFS transporter [Chloroflexota bacterium]